MMEDSVLIRVPRIHLSYIERLFRAYHIEWDIFGDVVNSLNVKGMAAAVEQYAHAAEKVLDDQRLRMEAVSGARCV